MAARRASGLIFATTAASVLVALAGCGNSTSPKTEGTAAASTPSTAGGGGTATTTTPVQTTPGTSATAAKKVTLEADPSGALKYTKSSITVKGTSVQIAFTNTSPLEHNVTVESSSGQQLGATPTFKGGTQTVTLASLKPGTYKFFCTVPGHRAAGMQGTLLVQE